VKVARNRFLWPLAAAVAVFAWGFAVAGLRGALAVSVPAILLWVLDRRRAVLEESTRGLADELRESEAFRRAVLDSLSPHIAVLDDSGRIVAVNEAWRRFARENGGERGVREGVDYLEVCRCALSRDCGEEVRAVMEGVRGVLEGSLESFRTDYSCPSPSEKRWFHMEVLPLRAERFRVMVIHEDVTERKRFRDRLKRSEERLLALIDATPDIICFKDGEGRWIQANDSILGLYRLKGADYRGRTEFQLADFAAPLYRDAFRTCGESDEKAWARGALSRTEEIIPDVDGGSRIFDVIKVPLFHPDGSRKGLVVFGRDITALKEVEDALRVSEEKYRLLVENAGEAVFVARDDRLTFANPQCAEITGYSFQELTSRPFIDFIHPDDRAMAMERRAKRLQGLELPPSYVFRIVRKEGETRWLELNSVAIQWEGAPATLHFAKDVTARQEAEEALRRRDALLQGVASVSLLLLGGGASDESINEALAVLGRITEVDRVYIFRNHDRPETGERLVSQKFEWTEDGVSPQLDNPGLQGLSYDRFCSRWWGVLEAGETVCGVVADFPASERAVLEPQDIVAILVAPIRVEGRFWGFIGFDECEKARAWSDSEVAVLTMAAAAFGSAFELREAEEENEKLQAQLLHSQKMESMGRLAGGVAHDFNNMLGVILGYSQMALLATPAEDSRHGQLRQIEEAARRSADLVGQLLAFARKQTIAPRVLELDETVQSTLKMLRRLVGEDIRLVWTPGVGSGKVKVDPSQIDQVLANLVVNSRDAMPGTGTITLETGSFVCGESSALGKANPDARPGEYFSLTVKDTGAGMDAETLERIFDPFFTTKETGRGTGLGLATVYGIARQNGGFVEVRSELGKGTAFSVYFPRFEGEEAAEGTDESDFSPMSRGTETILVVEDEEAILTLAGAILEGNGYTVLTARTPSEALALAEEPLGEIHLLLTDVVMPEMNGRELLERLRVRRPSIRSLFMSGYTDDVIAPSGVLGEGVWFIPKPFSVTALTRKVRELLDAPSEANPHVL